MNKRVKTLVVISIMALGGLMVHAGAAAAQDAKAFVGDWSGVISGGGEEIEIVCHFKLDENGALVGTLDAPGQGIVDITIADIVVEGKKISFGVDDPNVSGDPLFEGTLDEAGSKITGDFSQGGGTGTFELVKQ